MMFGLASHRSALAAFVHTYLVMIGEKKVGEILSIVLR